MTYVLIAFLILILLLLLFGWVISSKVIDPGEYRCQDLKRFVYCGNPKEEFGFRFQEIQFTSSDNFAIDAWYIPSSPVSKKAIVMVHGWGTDRHETMRYVPALHKAGFGLLLLDLRNCGKSQKSFNSMGFHEKKDTLAAVQYLIEKKKINKIGILGISLGSATSIMTMAREPKILAGFFEGGYSSLRDVLSERMQLRYHLPSFLIIDIALFFFELRTKAKAKEIQPQKDIAAISPRAVYIVHGTEDITVYPSNADRLYMVANEPKNFYLQKNGRHAEAWNLEPKKIEKMATNFFTKNLK